MDMLDFGDEQSPSNADMQSNINPMIEFSQQDLDGNSELYSFFPKTGLTPRTGFTPRTGLTPRTGVTPLHQESFANDMARYMSWNNASEIFGIQDSYFPPQSLIRELAMVESPKGASISSISNGSEVPEKPKRGRPRKSRAKKKLSEEQEREKRQKFLERNRQAASKCRERRRDWIFKQSEKMRLEQIQNASLRAEYEILSQGVHNMLDLIHQHTEAGCHSIHLKTFLMSESHRYIASLVDPGRQASKDLMLLAGHDHDSAADTPRAARSTSQNSQGSEAGDSGITNMGSSKKSQGEISDEGYDDGQIDSSIHKFACDKCEKSEKSFASDQALEQQLTGSPPHNSAT